VSLTRIDCEEALNPRCTMRSVLPVSIGLLLLTGCGPSVVKGVVSGTVTYKSQPVNGATLFLYPTTAGKGSEMTIPVNQEGTFRASDVPAGDYKVVVQPSAGNSGPKTKGMTKEQLAQMKEQVESMKVPATIKIPGKYTKQETSDLKMTVGAGEQTVPLELHD
jgi:hypothetical protein